MLRDRPPITNGDPNTSGGGEGYIEHRVSKLDTLAGVAIKYGVEVADVKRMNGLVTDYQMFAHNILKIPLPGKHPPSTILPKVEGPRPSAPSLSQKKNSPSPNFKMGLGKNVESRVRDKRPLSSAMNLLRGYYGLSASAQQTSSAIEGMEMTSYRSDSEDHSEDEPFSPITKPAVTVEAEHNGLANGTRNATRGVGKAKEISRLAGEHATRADTVPIMGLTDVDKAIERSVRRRSKVEPMNPIFCSYEKRQDMGILDKLPPSSVFSSGTEGSSGRTSGMVKVVDGTLAGGKGKEVSALKVIKSSSTSNLQDQVNSQLNAGSSKYGLKIDAKSANQTSLNQASSRPLFEGLSKPVIYRYKAALD